MTVAAVAVVGISAGSSMLAGNAKNKAAKKAQDLQNQNFEFQSKLAQQELNAAHPLIDDAMRAQLGYFSPYYGQGQTANTALQQGLGLAPDANGNYSAPLTRSFNAQDYQQDIGYTPMTSNQFTREQYGQMQGVPALVSNTLTADEWKNDGTGTYTATPTTLEELQATPGYQFQLQQGLQSVNNSAAAKGSLMSGRTMKELNNYAQGVASTGFTDAWNRWRQAYENAFARKQARFQQGQQGYADEYARNAQRYEQGRQALQNAYNRYGQNQQNQYSRLQNAANMGYQTAANMANITNNWASQKLQANKDFTSQMGGNFDNYTNNSGNIAYGVGQNNANMMQNLGNAATSLAGLYYTNNSGLNGAGGGGR